MFASSLIRTLPIRLIDSILSRMMGNNETRRPRPRPSRVLPYMTSERKGGGGSRNTPNLRVNSINVKFYGLRGQNSPKFGGRYIWKPPRERGRGTTPASNSGWQVVQWGASTQVKNQYARTRTQLHDGRDRRCRSR